VPRSYLNARRSVARHDCCRPRKCRFDSISTRQHRRRSSAASVQCLRDCTAQSRAGAEIGSPRLPLDRMHWCLIRTSARLRQPARPSPQIASNVGPTCRGQSVGFFATGGRRRLGFSNRDAATRLSPPVAEVRTGEYGRITDARTLDQTTLTPTQE
jgi:hypothetical protein